jgi:hypothetical protein
MAAPSPLAPLLMMAFWMLLGAAAGINVAQSLWGILGWQVGDIAVAVPVGAALGALCGALLGLITDPPRLVLLLAVFAGASRGRRRRQGALGRYRGAVRPGGRRCARRCRLGDLAPLRAAQGGQNRAGLTPRQHP